MCRPTALSGPHVYRQLQLCLPGVRVFLDVDNLKDISALESSIEQSAVVLIFLSKNYFGSRNCLREARASASMAKTLALVHEADPRCGFCAVLVTSCAWLRYV